MSNDNDLFGSVTVSVLKEKLILLPEKASYLPDHNILIISDIHLGKITHFRKHGIGIPHSASNDNFNRLGLLIDSIVPSRVIFLGDLFHSNYNSEWIIFKDFINQNSTISFELVLGNHDILNPDLYNQSKLKYSKSISIGQLILTHEPLGNIPDKHFNIYGHIHPAVKLTGTANQSLRLACFFFSDQYAVMPAFGTFTGMHTLKPKRSDNIYVIAENKVIKV